MISVPQLIMASTAAAAILGVATSYAVSGIYAAVRRRAKSAKVVKGTQGDNHYTLAPSAKAQFIANHYKWYGPKFSPKNVPRFYDMASLTESPKVFQLVIDLLAERYKAAGKKAPTHIAGYDARGFALGAPLALALGVPFVLFRKDRKSPGLLVESGTYEKEYKEATDERMCLRVGCIKPGDRVVLVDDLIATGGTAVAGMECVEALGAEVYEFMAVVGLPSLDGIQRIRTYKGGAFAKVPVFTLLDDDIIGDGNCADPKSWKEETRVIDKKIAERARVQFALS